MRAKPAQIRFWKDQDHVEYHTRQFKVPYRSTVSLISFIRSVLGNPRGEALDVACGAGANIYHLSQAFDGLTWTGIDIAGDVTFSIGRKYFRELGLHVDLIEGDMYRLTEIFPEKRFDVVLSAQTLMAIPEYEPVLDQLLKVTRNWLFVTSLFTDFDVDAKIAVVDNTRSIEGEPFYYNVYSLARFRSYCIASGTRQFVSEDFVIDIDLPQPERGGLNTYTLSLAGGRRLQFSGPLHLPWKFIGIRMGQQ